MGSNFSHTNAMTLFAIETLIFHILILSHVYGRLFQKSVIDSVTNVIYTSIFLYFKDFLVLMSHGRYWWI